jgi:CRP/FNR family cyclic AMP-dependent transcriptional regulator
MGIKSLLERQSPRLFEVLDAETAEKVQSCLTHQTFGDGELVNSRGDEVDHVLIVQRGAVRISRIDQGGNERIVAVLGKGQCIGQMQLLLGKPRTVDIYSEGESELGMLSRDDFFSLVDEQPEFCRALLVITLNRFHDALETIDDVGRLPLLIRTAKLIGTLPRAESDKTIVEWNQANLALVLGASRVAVGTALNQLSAAGLIEIEYGRIRVIDDGKLAEWFYNASGEALIL